MKQNVVTTGDGLYKDEYEDERYIFKGANPNNYIVFDGQMYRIISLEKDGTIKIISNFVLFSSQWNSQSGTNIWSNSTNPATINTYLNENYYNHIIENDKNKIVLHEWDVGLLDPDTNWKSMSAQIKDENSVKWNGKVGLPTVSEYVRANSNKNDCSNSYDHARLSSICPSTNWMTLKMYDYAWWTITGYKKGSNKVYRIYNSNIDGTFYNIDLLEASLYYGQTSPGVRPTVYLSSSISLKGSGTSSDPYIIK